MIEGIEKAADYTLQILNSSNSVIHEKSLKSNISAVTNEDPEVILNLLRVHNFIEVTGGTKGYGEIFRISELGKLVIFQGGYESMEKRKKEESNIQVYKDSLELKKLENEVILTKWQYYMFWVSSILAILLSLKEVYSFLRAILL